MDRLETIQKLLVAYGTTKHVVTKEFLQALCLEAAEAIQEHFEEEKHKIT